MSLCQTYKTKEDAENAIKSTFAGWNTVKAVQYLIPNNDGGADDVWIICCNGTLYLRTDGFVR